jgi:hypothetical protein
MKRLLCAALLCAASAHADLLYKNEDVQIRLRESKCELSPVLLSMVETMRPQYRDKWVGGVLIVRDHILHLCWQLDGDGVFIIDEDGDAGTIAVKNFSVDHGV